MAHKLVRAAAEFDAGEPMAGRSWLLKVDLYLIASDLYYARDLSLMADPTFDRLCGHLLDCFGDALAHSPAPGLVSADALIAGTGYHIPGRLPPSTRRLADEVVACIS